MRRLARRLFTLCSAVSLLLCVAALLSRTVRLDDESISAAAQISCSAVAMARMISDLLDFTGAGGRMAFKWSDANSGGFTVVPQRARVTPFNTRFGMGPTMLGGIALTVTSIGRGLSARAMNVRVYVAPSINRS